MSDYYDRAGNPISMDSWARMFADISVKRVAFTKVGPNAEVSTVWMGLDHSFGSGSPLIFETLVFGGPLDEEMDRYSTEEQARAGHEDMVKRVRYADSATFGGTS